MADKKISALTAASTPLAGTEVLPIVQSGATVKVAVSDLTAGRTVAASRLGTSNSDGGGVMATFTSGWSNTLVTIKGDGATGAGVMNISNAAASAALPYQLQLNGTKVLGSDTSGNVDVTIGNLVIGTSGKGIDFSATSGSGTSELLADYEEGTWTPGISFGGASVGVTYTSTSGYYTKVGNVVTVSCYINMSNKGSSTGSARITALPFTCANNAAAYAALSLFFANLTFAGQVNGYVNINDTSIDLFNTSVLGVASALTDTNFANNTGIILNLTYRVA